MIDRLEEALDHNYRFSADASHELRTPLTIMRGEMEEMLSIEDLPGQAVGNLVSTLEEIERMSRIVSSLMTITRLDAGGERMDLQVIDLSALVRTTMEHMRLLAEEKDLPLTCACETGVFVHADPMRLKQVLVNLIDNAIKYTPATGRVEVSVFSDGDHAVFRVSDTGVGISEEDRERVWQRLFRADPSRGERGLGLGLSLVKAVIEAHGGRVGLESTAQIGSTFEFRLPSATTFAGSHSGSE
jgi:signal transduction histidine kinase